MYSPTLTLSNGHIPFQIRYRKLASSNLSLKGRYFIAMRLAWQCCWAIDQLRQDINTINRLLYRLDRGPADVRRAKDPAYRSLSGLLGPKLAAIQSYSKLLSIFEDIKFESMHGDFLLFPWHSSQTIH